MNANFNEELSSLSVARQGLRLEVSTFCLRS